MTELLVVLPFCAFAYPLVVRWARHLQGQSVMDGFRPTAGDVDRAERDLGVH